MSLTVGALASCTAARAGEVLRLDFENAADLTEDTSGNGLVGAVAQSNFFGAITQSSDAQSGSGSASFEPNDYENGKYLLFDDAAFPDFRPTDSFAVTFWVQPTTAYLADGNGFRGMLSGLSETTLTTLDWQFENGDTVDGGIGDGTTTPSRFNSDIFSANLVQGGDLTAGQWTHIGLSYYGAGRDLAVFVDGQLRAAAADIDGLSTESLLVGANRSGSRLFDGLMDDVRVFDTPVVVNAPGAIQDAGDLDFSGTIDAADWALFKSGQEGDLSLLTGLQAYSLGDLDFDGDNDLADFNNFKALFDAANGPGAFATLIASVPEPSSGGLLIAAAALVFGRRRRRRVPTHQLDTSSKRLSMTARASNPTPLVWAFSLALAFGSSPAHAIQFDFGNGSIDVNTGVAANFVIGENDPLSVLSQTIDDVTLTLTPVVASDADFAMSQWGANTQGIGIRSLDSSGSTGVDSGANGGQRRRLAGSVGEAIHFSFDTDVVIDTLRLGALAPSDNTGTGDLEIVELSFVSGVDPFGGSGPLTITSDPILSTLPTEDLLIDTLVTAGTVLSLATNADNTTASGILFNDIVVSLPPVDPLTLQVFTDTGAVQIVNNSTDAFAIDYYKLSSADAEENGGSLNASGWTGLAGAAGFPAGDGSGNGWEPGDNNDALTIVESFLVGDSTISPNDTPASLGNAFTPGEAEDLTFTYHIAGSGETEVVGIVEYLAAGVGLPGDFNDDGVVDIADYTAWRDNFGAPDESALNGNGDGANGVDGGDYTLWVSNFGATASAIAVPEPSGLPLVLGWFVGVRLSRHATAQQELRRSV